MQKITLSFLLLTSINLFAYSDSDMDGISDKNDKCPNTLLSDLVDISGCSIKNLVSPHKFNVAVGISLSQTKESDTDTLTQNLQLNYNYKKFSLQASSSYYNTQSTLYDDDGTNDSYIGMGYKFSPVSKLHLRVGLGFIIPTYDSSLDNNNMDYTASVSASYLLNGINLFGRYSFTMINDDDTVLVYEDSSTVNVIYQNTSAYNIGLGIYPSTKTYASISYNSSKSVYAGAEDIESVSINLFYNLSKKVYTTLYYAYGLSDSASDNYTSLKVGYYF